MKSDEALQSSLPFSPAMFRPPSSHTFRLCTHPEPILNIVMPYCLYEIFSTFPAVDSFWTAHQLIHWYLLPSTEPTVGLFGLLLQTEASNLPFPRLTRGLFILFLRL